MKKIAFIILCIFVQNCFGMAREEAQAMTRELLQGAINMFGPKEVATSTPYMTVNGLDKSSWPLPVLFVAAKQATGNQCDENVAVAGIQKLYAELSSKKGAFQEEYSLGGLIVKVSRFDESYVGKTWEVKDLRPIAGDN